MVQAERKRNKHININLIVEEHYESYFEQEGYMREKLTDSNTVNDLNKH